MCYSFRMKSTKSKKKAVSVPTKPRWVLNEKTAPPIIALGAMVLVILLTLAWHTQIKPKSDKSQAPTNTAKQSGLRVTTSDGIALAAELTYPTGRGPFPVVIFVHEFGQDRSQWKPYVDEFLISGFAVLTYDTRGFGASSLAAIPVANAAYFSSMPNDVAAIVTYAKKQSKVDDGKVFVVGASLGANIALAESGRNPGIIKTVLLSPGSTSLLGDQAVAAASAKNILGISDSTDQPALETVMGQVAEPKKTMIASMSGHGVVLLQQPEVREAIRQWLAQ